MGAGTITEIGPALLASLRNTETGTMIGIGDKVRLTDGLPLRAGESAQAAYYA